LNINDEPRENTWSFARSDDDFTLKTPFLMPHYSSWSWPHPSLGPLDDALQRISHVESSTRWKDKIDKAVWRGTPWFNPDWRMGLRPMLIEVAGGREWADVEQAGQGQNNSINADGFCKYKYIVYTEVMPNYTFCRKETDMNRAKHTQAASPTTSPVNL
jgi:hypothetical protein